MCVSHKSNLFINPIFYFMPTYLHITTDVIYILVGSSIRAGDHWVNCLRNETINLPYLIYLRTILLVSSVIRPSSSDSIKSLYIFDSSSLCSSNHIVWVPTRHCCHFAATNRSRPHKLCLLGKRWS